MKDKQKPQLSTLPEEFSSMEEAGEFWDTHSTDDYEDIFEPVDFKLDLPPRIGKRVRLTRDLALKLGVVSQQQGVSMETMVNLWLQEKLEQLYT